MIRFIGRLVRAAIRSSHDGDRLQCVDAVQEARQASTGRARPFRRPHDDGGWTFHWACFAAQQAAEKAMKALYQHHNAEGWGHVLDRLIEGLLPDEPRLAEFRDKAKALDKLYIPTRYPSGLESGAPADSYTADEAARAIDHAKDIIGFYQTRCGAG